ncbi:MAG: hypothetical protein ABIQ18_18985 [Umezawaea sp.]
MTTPDNERFTDAMRPRLVAAATTYPSAPAGPVRRAPLSDASGQLGWVWTDDLGAAGWEPGEPTVASARAGAYVWRVLQLAHGKGESVSVVLAPARYAPLYRLGDPTEGDKSSTASG